MLDEFLAGWRTRSGQVERRRRRSRRDDELPTKNPKKVEKQDPREVSGRKLGLGRATFVETNGCR